MKKTSKKLVSLLGAFLFSFSAVGCNPTEPEGEMAYELWTTYNTMKVVQDSALNGNYEKMPIAINVSMAKGEQEMGSFYITNTGEKEISSFDLKVSDLVHENGVDKIPTDSMEVFAQMYVEVISKSQGNNLTEYPLGYTPDPMVPIDLYKGEKEDKIPAGANQGITVDFETTRGAKEGKYTGTFVLDLDGKKENIPVTVEVWDIAMPETSYAGGCWLIYERQIIQQEGITDINEVVGKVGDQEMNKSWYESYFEQALDFKATPYLVPYALSNQTTDKFVEQVKRYWDHPNFTKFGFPHQSFIDGKTRGGNYADLETTDNDLKGDLTFWADAAKAFMLASAKDGINYLDRAYIYPFDEPADKAAFETCQNWINWIRYSFAKVANEEEVQNAFRLAVSDGTITADFAKECFRTLLNVDIVITAGSYYYDYMLDSYNYSSCPTFDKYEVPLQNITEKNHYIAPNAALTNSINNGTVVADGFERKFGMEGTTIATDANKALYQAVDAGSYTNVDDQWSYSHIRPNNPSPNLHIDDFLVGTRSMNWLLKQYNIKNYLYYDYCSSLSGTVTRRDWHGENRYQNVNKSPGLSANGDGFVVYAAARYYGATKPIEAMRLFAWRDGVEDRDMMYMLEDVFKAYETYYGVETGTFAFNKVMSGLLERLLCEIVAYSQDEVFYEVRNALAGALINAQKGENKFVYDLQQDGTTAKYAFYTAPGYQVEVNGTVLTASASGSGLKHAFEMDFANASLLSSVVLINIETGARTTMPLYEITGNDGDRAIDLSKVTYKATENSIADGSTGKLELTIKSIGEDSYANPKDSSELKRKRVKVEALNFPDFKVLEFDITNNKNEDVVITLYVYSAKSSYSRSIDVRAGSTYRVNFLNRLPAGQKVQKIELRFDNAKLIGTTQDYEVYGKLPDRSLTISNMLVRSK